MRLVLLLVAIGSLSAWAQETTESPPPTPPAAPTEPAPTPPEPAHPETSAPEPAGAPEAPEEEPAAKPVRRVRKKKTPAPAPAPVAETPPPSPPDAGPAPAPEVRSETPAPTPRKGPDADRAQVQETARLFFSYLLSSDLRSAMNLAQVPFVLEDRRIGSSEELFQAWLKQLREKRTELLTLYGVELFTAAEMEKKYGKPPERLKALPYREPHTYVAVANLSGRAAIAVLRMEANGSYRVVGYTD